MKSRWIWIAVFVALGLLAVGYWRWSNGGLEVAVAEAGRQTIQAYVDERGISRLPNRYEITMPFDGRIEGFDLRAGDKVYAGQLVARVAGADMDLEVSLYEAAKERLLAAIAENADTRLETTGKRQADVLIQSMAASAEASQQRVLSAQAWTEYWQTYLDRLRTLTARSAATDDELQRGQANLRSSVSEVSQTEKSALSQTLMHQAMQMVPQLIGDYLHRKQLQGDVLRKQLQEADVQLDQAKLRRQRAQMTSPVDGIVLQTANDSEQFLRAGSPLVTIGQLERLEFEADILTQEAASIRVGSPVFIYGPSLEREAGQGIAGRVRRVEPDAFTKVSSLGVEEQRVTVMVVVDDVPALLREFPSFGVGFRVRMRIVTEEKTDALAVPRSALFRQDDGGWGVFVVRDDRAERQAVEVGLMNEEWVEIVRGVQAGEAVIVAPESALVDGARVKIR